MWNQRLDETRASPGATLGHRPGGLAGDQGRRANVARTAVDRGGPPGGPHWGEEMGFEGVVVGRSCRFLGCSNKFRDGGVFPGRRSSIAQNVFQRISDIT